MLFEACVHVAVEAAERGSPIQRQRGLEKWQLDSIERTAGVRPSNREAKEQLENAIGARRLRYVKGYGKQVAGFFPIGTDPDMLRTCGFDTYAEQKKRERKADADIARQEAAGVPAHYGEEPM